MALSNFNGWIEIGFEFTKRIYTFIHFTHLLNLINRFSKPTTDIGMLYHHRWKWAPILPLQAPDYMDTFFFIFSRLSYDRRIKYLSMTIRNEGKCLLVRKWCSNTIHKLKAELEHTEKCINAPFFTYGTFFFSTNFIDKLPQPKANDSHFFVPLLFVYLRSWPKKSTIKSHE